MRREPRVMTRQVLPSSESALRWIGWFLLLLVVAFVLWLLWPRSEPVEWIGVDRGLVFAECGGGATGLFRDSIELWVVDPRSGEHIGHTESKLPRGTTLAYSCDEPSGLARRLFNADFTQVAVQIHNPDTGADRIGIFDLRTGETTILSEEPARTYSALPQDTFAIFDRGGSEVWYRSGDDGQLHTVDVSSGRHTTLAAPDAQAEGLVILEEGADRSVPNEAGDAAVSGNRLVQIGGEIGEQIEHRLLCSGALGASLFATRCLPQEPVANMESVEPAAWVDDRTLLAFAGPDGRGEPNTIVRLDFSDDFTDADTSRTLPPSDWRHYAVAVAPDDAAYATKATRNGVHAVFCKELDAPPRVNPTQLPITDIPEEARLIDWYPGPGGRTGDCPAGSDQSAAG